MNVFAFLGFLLLLSVVGFGISHAITPKEYHLFTDYAAIFLVVGGTLAVGAIVVQANRIDQLFKSFYVALFKGKRIKYSDIILEIMEAGERYRKGENLTTIMSGVTDDFFRDGLEILNDNIIKDDELPELLGNRAKNLYLHYNEDALRFRSLGKFPPAFGLLGTVLGMIALLSNLGGADAMKMIGPAMAMALVATFLGIVMANVFILPIAESLGQSAKEIYFKNKIVVEGIKLMALKTNPIIIAENLNSFLLPKDRVDWKQIK